MPGRRKNDTVEVVVLSESDQDMEQPSDRNRPTPTTSQPVVEDVMYLTCDTDEEEKVVPGRIRIKGKYNWNKGVETVTYQEFKNKKPEEWLHLYPRGILVECLDHVPDCLADHVKVIQVPSTLRLNAKDWEEVTGAFKTGCKQFRTIHPKEEKTPLPMQLQSMQRQFDDTAAAAAQQPTDASHVIGRLQGAACQMAMHTDCPSRNYSVNLVWRQCTDGTGGSVDFLNSKQPTIVYRIIFSVPSVYLMSAYGGGITRDHEGSQWAHGVDTATLGQGHHLCALVVEYPTPVQFSSMTELLAARWAGIGMSMDMSTCSLTSQQLQALNVPTEWPASPKTVISQLIGSFGGKASAASSRGQAQVASRASKKQKKDRSPIEQKAVDDRQAAGQAAIAMGYGFAGVLGTDASDAGKTGGQTDASPVKKAKWGNPENTKWGHAGSTNLSPEQAKEKRKKRKAGQENLSTNDLKADGGKTGGTSAQEKLWWDCMEQASQQVLNGNDPDMVHAKCLELYKAATCGGKEGRTTGGEASRGVNTDLPKGSGLSREKLAPHKLFMTLKLNGKTPRLGSQPAGDFHDVPTAVAYSDHVKDIVRCVREGQDLPTCPDGLHRPVRQDVIDLIKDALSKPKSA